MPALTVRSIEQVSVQGGGYGNETVRQMTKIKADDAAIGPFSTLEMVVSPSDAVAMELSKGGNLSFAVESTGLAIDAVSPASIVEDVETEVLIAGRGFTSATVVQVLDDSDEQIGEDLVPTVISANALTVDVTVADAVVGSIQVVNGATTSNALAFTVTAA
jgi:hypothetical protein